MVLKSGEFSFLLREARSLLALPRGIAPRLLDLRWFGNGRLELVREYLEGDTLDQCAVEVGTVSELAQMLCQSLAHLHRTGYIYSDLKPRNVLLLGSAAEAPLRFLDFGFALHRFGGEEIRGGTAPYFAPELGRGGSRTDGPISFPSASCSSGSFPKSQQDPRWTADSSARLTDEMPANRYPPRVAAAGRKLTAEPSVSRPVAASLPALRSWPDARKRRRVRRVDETALH